MKTKSSPTTNSINRSSLRRGLLLISLLVACFGLSLTARAVSPPPDGGYRDKNTAEGDDALLNLAGGGHNTAIGFEALINNTAGSFNTANGALALANNIGGGYNTAIGAGALFKNVGGPNTAIGFETLFNNTGGFYNTAIGFEALFFNIDGIGNTGIGENALLRNKNGTYNTAIGLNALINQRSGSGNIALGFEAGSGLHHGDNNIYIGASSFNSRQESNNIRIGLQGTHTATFIAGISGVTVAGGVGVIIDNNGQLGTISSSARFKEAIKPMDEASEAILALHPVTFHYKKELDADGIPQFGLVAEEVEKVNPDLVARDAKGEVYTVRYEAVNAMLLNEFLKEHRKVEQQEATITELTATMAQQQKDFTARLKEQDSKIQNVSAQLATSKPAQQVAENNP